MATGPSSSVLALLKEINLKVNRTEQQQRILQNSIAELNYSNAEWVHTKYPTGLSEAEWILLAEADLQFNYSGVDAFSQDIEEEILETGFTPIGEYGDEREEAMPTYQLLNSPTAHFCDCTQTDLQLLHILCIVCTA